MKILSARNPKYSDASGTAIDMEIEIEGIGFVPFSASATDTEPHGRALHADAIAAKFGTIMAFVPKVKTQAELDNDASNTAKAILTKLSADIFPDVLAFLATLPGAPLSIKNAAIVAAAEKVKIK